MILFIGGALGFGFGMAFLAECFRSIFQFWYAFGRRIG